MKVTEIYKKKIANSQRKKNQFSKILSKNFYRNLEYLENMSSNNQTAQNYSDLPMDQTGNNLAPLQILDSSNNTNIQHSSINGVANTFAAPMPQNVTFEFYFPLPNDTRIYHVTYTELHPLENARLLNNSINLSH